MHERVFIPLPGRESKVVIARPVFEVGHRLDVVWTTFTKRPDAYDFHSRLRSLVQRLRHACAIFVAIHHRYVCAHKAKGFAANKEASAALPYELVLRNVGSRVW